jgi:hypothetical protein
MFDVALGGLVWGFIVYGMRRGYRQARQLDRYVLITWTIFLSLGVVYTLRIRAVQPVIDPYFFDYPVTFLVSLLAVLTATVAYSLSLKWLVQRSPEICHLRWFHDPLIRAAPGVVGLLLAIMVVHIAGGLSSFRTQHLMKWLEEGYALLHAALVFVPVNAAMFRKERIFPMRVKHLATLALCATFALSAACSVVFLPSMIVTQQPYEGDYAVPRAPIAVVCLLIILVPHRWLTVLLLPSLLRCYARLAALERRIGRLVDIRREPLTMQQAVHPPRIEMAIYVTVINILDHYRRVDLADPVGCELVGQIEALWPQCAGYDELVEGLCHITL